MYAVIATGGKQYRVAAGDVVRIEKLTAEPGGTVEFDKVLLVGQGTDIKVGAPFLAGGKVTGTVQKHGNTSAASAVLALDEAVRDGRIQDGQLVLLQGVGGGMTWGSVLVRWG